MQVAVVHDPQLPYVTVYTNGVLAAIGSISIPFSSLVDSHDYLGRSGYNSDPYLSGTIKEFRVYSGDMSAVQVAADYAAGPDNVDTNIAWLTNITLTATSPVYPGQTCCSDGYGQLPKCAGRQRGFRQSQFAIRQHQRA